jgi:hypothetical protein
MADQHKRTSSEAAEPPAVPPQGYDVEGSDPIAPPTGVELLRTAAGMAGELARGGGAAGWRLLTGALRRGRD